MKTLIAKFLELAPRNKVVFVPCASAQLRCIDVGQALAAAIEPHLASPALPQIAEDALRGILNGAKQSDQAIGPYVALRNWGILFEPALKINIPSLISQYDKNQTLVLVDCGTVVDGNFKLANKSSDYGFPIAGLGLYTLT